MAGPRSVLIVDDHPLIREGLRGALCERGWKVLAEAEDGRSALEYAEQLCPDVVLVDISLPDMSGLEVTRRVRQTCRDVRVVVLSVHRDAKYLVEAFEAGANGYVAKRSTLDTLFECLDATAHGRLYVDPFLSDSVVEHLRRTPRGDFGPVSASPLTAREEEVVRLLAQGLSTREVGERLFISRKTADNHRAHILKKLGFRSAVDLVRYAASRGMLELDSEEESSQRSADANPPPTRRA